MEKEETKETRTATKTVMDLHGSIHKQLITEGKRVPTELTGKASQSLAKF